MGSAANNGGTVNNKGSYNTTTKTTTVGGGSGGAGNQSPNVSANNGGKATAVAADGTGPGQWLSANDHSTINATNKDVGNTTMTSDSSTHSSSVTGTGGAGANSPAVSANNGGTAVSKIDNSTNINALLKDSVVGSGTLNQSRAYTATNTIMAGAGSAVSSASLAGNNTKQVAASSSASGQIDMHYSMNGMGILQANQNTGSAAVQGNSVALTSTVGANGGGLSGFSPTVTGPLH